MKIHTAEFVVSNADVRRCPADMLPEYAFIGRSNVGKSSLINCLTRHEGLAKTSSTPGKTLLINHFLINKAWYLVDLPGYGYARRSKREQEKLARLIQAYVTEREQLTSLFVLIDSRLTPQKIDLEFIERLGLFGVPFALVFTKADKPKRGELARNVSVFLNKLSEQWEPLPPYFVTSSSTRQGCDEVLAYIESVNRGLEA